MKIKHFTALSLLAFLILPSASLAQTTSVSYEFNQNLTLGSTGADVIALQQLLIRDGFLTSVSTPTGYFGTGTQAALAKFQAANGIYPASGYFGSKTRVFENSMSIATPPAATATSYPTGCSSSSGYSTTTGQSCSAPASSNQEGQNIIQNNLAQPTPAPQTNYSASTLGNNLAPQLAFITCNWYNNYGDVLFSQSSNGILGPAASNGNYFITTVLGGISNTSYMGGSVIYPSSCSIQFPAGTSLYAGGLSSFTVSRDSSGNGPVGVSNPNVDFGQVIIENPNTYVVDYARKVNYCSTRASVGNSIAVFGWPINSTNETLTGTILSNTLPYYDTTNITVPNGMQGSTAVSLTNGCVIGQINSLGQIADIQALSYVMGW